MSIRPLLLSASAVAVLCVQPAAAQGLPYYLQFRCPEPTFFNPLIRSNCDNERARLAILVPPADMRDPHDKGKPRKDIHKFKRVLLWNLPHHPLEAKSKGSTSEGRSAQSTSSPTATSTASGVSGTVSRTTSAVSSAVNSVLD
jgi:hypothetical protein